MPDSAAAQATAAQRNAVRHYCRAEFAAKCPGVRAGEAIICLEANLDDLSRSCQKAALTPLGVYSEAEPVANAAPIPTPRALSRTAPIVSTKPSGPNADAQRAERRDAPVAATKEAADEPSPPKYATPRKSRTVTRPMQLLTRCSRTRHPPTRHRPSGQPHRRPSGPTPCRPRKSTSSCPSAPARCRQRTLSLSRDQRPRRSHEFRAPACYRSACSRLLKRAYRTAWSRRR
jgi:hypothetical protein